MYIFSDELLSKIHAAIARVKSILPELEFDEYIAIPDFGANIILRFEYAGKDKITLYTLDSTETKLREAVGKDFMANLMGNASRQCGVDFSRLNEILIRIDANESTSIRTSEAHRDGLASDSAAVRNLFSLPDHFPLWEIQANPEGLLVLALHSSDEQPPFSDKESSINGQSMRVHFLPDDGSFRGLMKAAAIAAERKISITHVLLDYSRNL